jgi:hypothetical protein
MEIARVGKLKFAGGGLAIQANRSAEPFEQLGCSERLQTFEDIGFALKNLGVLDCATGWKSLAPASI